MLLYGVRKSSSNIALGRPIDQQQAHTESKGRGLKAFCLNPRKIGTVRSLQPHQCCYGFRLWDEIVQQLKTLCSNFGRQYGDAGHIAPRMVEARYKALLYGVSARSENNRDCLRGRLGGLRSSACGGHDHRHRSANEFRCERPHPVVIVLSTAVFEVYVTACDVTCLRQALAEGCHRRLKGPGRIEPPYGRQRPLLCARRQRPCRRRAAE